MTPVQALALRRAGTAGAALLATVLAHLMGGGLGLTARAPFIWLALCATAAILGRRTGSFRPRGLPRTLGLLVILQAVAHALMTVAPWAFGLSAHHAHAFAAPPAILAHLAAAVLLALLLSRIERAVARLLQRVLVLVRWARRRAPRHGGAFTTLGSSLDPLPRIPTGGARVTRGPPLLGT